MANHRFLYGEPKLVFKGFETFIYNPVLKQALFGLGYSPLVFFKSINVMLTKFGKAALTGSVLGVKKNQEGKGVKVSPAVRGNSSLGKACLGGLAKKLRPCKLARTIKKDKGADKK